MRHTLNLMLCCLLAGGVMTLAGCDNKPSDTKTSNATDGGDDHADGDGHADGDEHDHPETLDDGLHEVMEMVAKITGAFENEKPDDAHGPLHDIGHLLEDVEGLVDKSDLSDDSKTAAKGAISSLFESFGAIDDKIHNAEGGKDYADVSEAITKAMETLDGLHDELHEEPAEEKASE